ncbi:FAD monooxygenase [Aspergillus luchuensis]|uniref:FAD monooxygenase n=1 Tax=Aspergillus kawachii TaxID=1069201 RepID=A0A146FMZ5_ASPKA|nr:FAD monooxygenase [Aspergillus luchuensis]
MPRKGWGPGPGSHNSDQRHSPGERAKFGGVDSWTASPKPGEGLGMVTRKAIAVAKEDPSGRELAIEARWIARRGSKHQPPSTRHDEAQRE